jgi:transcriptional antiterminator RfaH
MKHEALAFNSLMNLGIESFLPQIRYRGTGYRLGRWVVEPLFPNYLFSKFDLQQQSRTVKYARGVSGLVHFGCHCPVIPTAEILRLQAAFSLEQLTTVEQTIKIGERVLIDAGPMRGSEGIVQQVLPGGNRAALLLEFLGQQTRLEIDLSMIQLPDDPRVMLAGVAA